MTRKWLIGQMLFIVDTINLKNIDLWFDSGVSLEKIVGLRRGEIENHNRNKHVVEELFNYVLNN